MPTAGATQGLQIGLKLPSHSRDLLVNAKKASIHAAVGTVVTQLGLSGTAATMVSATATAVASQASRSLILNHGNVDKTLRALGKSKALKSFIAAGVTAGVLNVIATNTVLGSELISHPVTSEFTTVTVKGLAQTWVEGGSLQHHFLQTLALHEVDGLNKGLAYYIGDLKADGVLNPVSHMMAHVALGMGSSMTTSLITKQNILLGGLSGAVGGLGETMARSHLSMTQARRQPTQSEVDLSAQFGQYATIFLSGMAGLDPNIALQTATNAIENNFLPHIVYYSIVAASIGYSIYQVHQTYQQEGLVPMLKHLGIEIAVNVATAGVGRVAGQVAAPYVYKIGTRIYPSLQSALNAVLDGQPILRRGINKLVEKLTRLSDQAINSAIGQHFARIDAKIMAAEQKVIGKFKSSKIADSQSSSSSTTSTTSNSTSSTSTTTERFIQKDWQNELNIPQGWNKIDVKKQDGVKYRLPGEKPKDFHEVRVMKGRPDSDFPGQQVDYIKLNKKGRYYDINGSIVDRGSQEAHIPLNGNEKTISNLIKRIWE